MKIKIKVTKEILERSAMCGIAPEQQFISSNCAVALAVRDIFPGASVDGESILTSFTPMVCVELPNEARVFIRRFDDFTPELRRQMQPISFDIEVPDSVIERIGISQVHKILSESKTLEYVG